SPAPIEADSTSRWRRLSVGLSRAPGNDWSARPSPSAAAPLSPPSRIFSVLPKLSSKNYGTAVALFPVNFALHAACLHSPIFFRRHDLPEFRRRRHVDDLQAAPHDLPPPTPVTGDLASR